MIGQVENITRFGLFVKISTDKLDESTEKLADKAVSKNRGLLRWSQIPKNVPKVQIGDLIGVEISNIHEDGKVDLNYMGQIYDRCKKRITAALLTDVVYFYTPPQITLATLLIEDEALVTRYLETKFPSREGSQESVPGNEKE